MNKGSIRCIELILVTQATGGRDGIVPLNPHSMVNQIFGKLFIRFHVLGRNRLLLVDEVSVKAVIVCKLNQFFGYWELSVLVFLQQFTMGLACTGKENTADGFGTIFMGGVGLCRVWHIDQAELESAVSPIASRVIQVLWNPFGSYPMPGSIIIGVLPVVKGIRGESVVKSRCFKK